MRFFPFICLLLLGSASGCRAFPLSTQPTVLSAIELRAITADCCDLICEAFIPAQTVLSISSEIPFTDTLATALRVRGFAIVNPPSQREALPLVCFVTATEEDKLVVQVRIADWGANRLYVRAPDRDALSPASGFAVFQEGDAKRRQLSPAPTPPEEAQLLSFISNGAAPELIATEVPALATVSAPSTALPTSPTTPLSTNTDVVAPAPALPSSVALALPTTPAADDEGLNVVTPNADHEIELDPRLFDVPSGLTSNPFVQLYRAPAPLRDFKFIIAAAIPGPNPTAIINGRIYSLGDNIEGLRLHRIEDETVWLRKNTFLLRCPVDLTPLLLRMP